MNYLEGISKGYSTMLTQLAFYTCGVHTDMPSLDNVQVKDMTRAAIDRTGYLI